MNRRGFLRFLGPAGVGMGVGAAMAAKDAVAEIPKPTTILDTDIACLVSYKGKQISAMKTNGETIRLEGMEIVDTTKPDPKNPTSVYGWIKPYTEVAFTGN